jgi:hypothetical protein
MFRFRSLKPNSNYFASHGVLISVFDELVEVLLATDVSKLLDLNLGRVRRSDFAHSNRNPRALELTHDWKWVHHLGQDHSPI